MNRNLLIILRTCTRVNMINDSGSGRYIKVPKPQLVNVCVSSLVNAINQTQSHTIKLIVLDDHSDQAAVDDIKRIISHCKFPSELIAVQGGSGNGYTMGEVYRLVEEQAADLWYHVEDDYLHQPSAIQDMLDTVTAFEQATGKMIAMNPHDDVWRYTQQIYPSFLLMGPYRHYRTVKHTTYTCLANRKIYDRYRQHFQDVVSLTTRGEPWVENKSINMVWNQADVLLFSPIPGLAFHIMDESGKDPYFDIDALWQSVPRLWESSGSTNPKIAIVSMFTENAYSLAEYTWTNKQKYAAKHNYLAKAKTSDFDKEQIHFDKFTHILDVMNQHPEVEWIWWLDNDAMITNFDIKVESLIDNDFHIIMSTDVAALNTGSFLVRNSTHARDWLEFILSKKQEYKNDKKWFEQQAVIDFYPKFEELFLLIPQKWLNSYDYNMYNIDGIDLLNQSGQWSPGDLVIHWPGLPNDMRIQLAQHYQKFIQGAE